MIQMQNRPLMIAAESFETISNFEFVLKDLRERMTYSIQDGIAIIPIRGLLTRRDEMFYETTNYEDIQTAVAQAIEDDAVHSILLDIDSPGGEVSGLFPLVDFIYKARDQKPVFAYANDHAFSAAYAIASAASKIFVNRTSGVGSIGVIATHVNFAEAEKKAGVKYTTIFAGEKKNDLSPHENLSENAVQDLQAEVERLYNLFALSVSRNRGISIAKIFGTEAATYFGFDGVNVGLADEVTEDPIEKIKEKFGAVPGISAKSEEKMTDTEEKISEVEKYRAEVLEITKLCKLAWAEDRISEFVEQRLTPEQVKEKLLASIESVEQINSAHYLQEAKKDENPMLAAARKRVMK